MKKVMFVAAALMVSGNAHALKALSQCNEYESLPLIQAIDQAEVQANSISKHIMGLLTQAKQAGGNGQHFCDAANRGFTEYKAAGQSAINGINKALGPIAQLDGGGNGKCSQELKADLTAFKDNVQTLQANIERTCGAAGSVTPTPDDNRPRPR